MVQSLLVCLSLVATASASKFVGGAGFGHGGVAGGGAGFGHGSVAGGGAGFGVIVGGGGESCAEGGAEFGGGAEFVVGAGFGPNLSRDSDGDGKLDHVDVCPNDPAIHTVDFRTFTNKSLDNDKSGQLQAVFKVDASGTGVTQSINSKPALMFGQDSMKGLDFDGKFKIDSANGDNDYVGFIFGYVNTSSFYVVMWKKNSQPSFECGKSTAEPAPRGLQLKRVHSKEGPSCALQDALWSGKSTPNETTVLWEDSTIGWDYCTVYKWQLIHRPEIGLIRVRFFQGTTTIADSGDITDHGIKGGHVGVYCHSQEGIEWADLHYSCNEDIAPKSGYDELHRHNGNGFSVHPAIRHSPVISSVEK